MIAINVSAHEVLNRTQRQLAAALVQCEVLTDLLNRCADLMTPEQLVAAGLAEPTPEPADAPVTELSMEQLGELVRQGEPVALAARKNGKTASAT
jgi:hypothetical protein